MSERNTIDHGLTSRWPNNRPPAIDPAEKIARITPEAMLPCPNAPTIPASSAANEAMKKNPTTLETSTVGYLSTAPSRLREGGMRTLPSCGAEMNQMPPPTINAAASSSPQTVLIWVETNTAATGPMIQIISCAEASSEKSAVIWLPGTSFG